MLFIYILNSIKLIINIHISTFKIKGFVLKNIDHVIKYQNISHEKK